MARKDFRLVRDKFASDSGLPFGRILTRDYVLSVLESEGHTYRQGVFCPLVTLWGWLSQCLSQDKSLNEAVSRILVNRVASGLPACSASSASYSNARNRFPFAAMKRLAKEIGMNVHRDAEDAWHWRGREVFLADGTCLSMPDTPENQLAYPQPKTQKAGIGFPVMRAVALLSLSTGAVVDFDFAPFMGKGTGEGALLRGMLDTLNRGDVLVADRYYPSYRTVAELLKRGIDLISVSHKSRHVNFNDGIQLGTNDHIVEWRKDSFDSLKLTREEHASLPDTIPVREFEIVIEGRDGFSEKAIVVSTIVDPEVPQSELADLYWRRWNCELDLRSIKQSMHMDILRCKTPEMVEKEIYCHLLAYNLLRGTMTASAKRVGLLPRQLSVKGTMQAVESFTPAMMAVESGDKLYDAMLKAVSTHRVANRPGRLEPRAKKRRPAWQVYLHVPRNQCHRRLASELDSLR